MMAVRDEEAIETLEEVLEEMNEIAQKLRRLGNARIRAYCLADFEGREGGWLGRFVRDVLEEELRELREGREGMDEEDDEA
jgi:DNA-binding Lrp family transcriptional regulator